MGLQVGQKARMVVTGKKNRCRDGFKRERYGTVKQITERVITIKTKKYNMSFNVNDVVSPNEYYLFLWSGYKWEMLQVSQKTKSFKELRLGDVKNGR